MAEERAARQENNRTDILAVLDGTACELVGGPWHAMVAVDEIQWQWKEVVRIAVGLYLQSGVIFVYANYE